MVKSLFCVKENMMTYDPSRARCSLIGFLGLMDLNELLSYKPAKRAGEKRPREGSRENAGPPSKTSRSQGSGLSRPPADTPPVATTVQDSSPAVVLDLNGISYEEKLRLLQTVDVDEEDLGESV